MIIDFMSLNLFKDLLFDIINESDILNVSDIISNEKNDSFIITVGEKTFAIRIFECLQNDSREE